MTDYQAGETIWLTQIDSGREEGDTAQHGKQEHPAGIWRVLRQSHAIGQVLDPRIHTRVKSCYFLTQFVGLCGIIITPD